MLRPAFPRTIPQMVWVSGGRIALVGMWFLATILISRVLGVAGFGLFVYCQTAIKIVTGCIGDPLDMAVMREGPLLLNGDRQTALNLVRSAFWLRVLIGGLVLSLAVLFPAITSHGLFGQANLLQLAIITAAGVLGDFLLRSALGYFQISATFGRFMAVDSVWQTSRVIAVLTLYFMHRLTPWSAVALYVAAPYVAFGVGWFLLPADIRQAAPPHRAKIIGILHYGKWIFAGMTMAAAYERLDVILLRHFSGDHQLGIYAGALTWAVIPDFINGILQTVLAPRIAPAYAAGNFKSLQQNYLKFAVPAGAAFAIFSIGISGWAIRTFMSVAYIDSINVFRILVLGTLFNSIFTPLPEALVNFVAPKRATLYTAVGLIWVAGAGAVLIPVYGAMGAAMVMLFARLIAGLLVIAKAQQLASAAVVGTSAFDPIPE